MNWPSLLTFVESKNIREKYKHITENLKQELTETIVNNSIESDVQEQSLQRKLDEAEFLLKCQNKSNERHQSELIERLKAMKNSSCSNNTNFHHRLDTSAKPCLNSTQPRSKVVLLERLLAKKDDFIRKLQDNLENISGVLLKQRKVLLLSLGLVRVQRILLDFYSSKLKNASASTFKHTEGFSDTYGTEVDQTWTGPLTHSEVIPETKLQELRTRRTHFYHLENTFCSRNGQKYTYQPEHEGSQNTRRSRLKSLWMAAANHRYLDAPQNINTNDSITVWAKVHSDDDKFYYLELKPRNT